MQTHPPACLLTRLASPFLASVLVVLWLVACSGRLWHWSRAVVRAHAVHRRAAPARLLPPTPRPDGGGHQRPASPPVLLRWPTQAVLLLLLAPQQQRPLRPRRHHQDRSGAPQPPLQQQPASGQLPHRHRSDGHREPGAAHAGKQRPALHPGQHEEGGTAAAGDGQTAAGSQGSRAGRLDRVRHVGGQEQQRGGQNRQGHATASQVRVQLQHHQHTHAAPDGWPLVVLERASGSVAGGRAHTAIDGLCVLGVAAAAI